jgi:hypothetical protein
LNFGNWLSAYGSMLRLDVFVYAHKSGKMEIIIIEKYKGGIQK